MSAAEGHCACGEIRYRLAGRPFAIHCCHCRDCQRETGSAFVINGLVEADLIEVLKGAPQTIDTPAQGGRSQKIVRCPSCQVALWSHYGDMGEKACFVRVGTLDDPAALPPQVHIFTRSKQPWVLLSDDAPAFETFYSRDDLDRLFGQDGAARSRALRNA